MKKSLLALALVASALSLAGCNGMPTFTVRSPILPDIEPPSVAGPRAVETRGYAFPTYGAPVIDARSFGPACPTAPTRSPCGP